jgi:hypothetical protein
MSVPKSKKQKKQPPQKCSTVAVTRPEDEQDHSELEKKAAAMYGFDIEADRRLDNEHWERRRRLRDRYHTARCSGSRPGLRSAPHWNSRRPARLNRFLTWLAVARLTCSPANGPTTPAWRFAWAKAWCNATGSIPRIKWIGRCAGGETAT